MFLLLATYHAEAEHGLNRSGERRPGKSGRLPRWLRLEDSDDLMRARVNDEDFIADHDVFIATPLGIDHEDFSRQRVEADAVRNACSHTD